MPYSPKIDADFSTLYEIMTGPVQSKLLFVGMELKVFNQLKEPRSSREVAEALGTHLENTRLFLNGLTAMGLVTKSNHLYQNTPFTQTSLVEGSPTCFSDMLRQIASMRERAIADLSALVKKGPPLPSKETDMGDEEVWARYAVSMANYQRAGAAQQAVEIVSAIPEFSSFKTMLDLGGGPGIIGIALVKAHPTMNGVIFDQPAVARIAEQFIKEHHMENRITTMGGDYNEDPIGGKYDLIWASTTLNFAKPNIDSLTQKIYESLNPGGYFVSIADGLTCERTQPGHYVLDQLPSALMGHDFGMNQGVIAGAMVRTGFQTVRSQTIQTPMMPMELDIARKALYPS